VDTVEKGFAAWVLIRRGLGRETLAQREGSVGRPSPNGRARSGDLRPTVGFTRQAGLHCVVLYRTPHNNALASEIEPR